MATDFIAWPASQSLPHERDAADYGRLHNNVLSRPPGGARPQSSFAIRTVMAADQPR